MGKRSKYIRDFKRGKEGPRHKWTWRRRWPVWGHEPFYNLYVKLKAGVAHGDSESIKQRSDKPLMLAEKRPVVSRSKRGCKSLPRNMLMSEVS